MGHSKTNTNKIEQSITAKAKTKEVNMTFDELQDEVRKRYPGTLSVRTKPDSTDIYINYGPLGMSVDVPFCEDIDIFCHNYVKLLVVSVNSKIEYHRSTIKSLEYFTGCLKASLPEKLSIEELEEHFCDPSLCDPAQTLGKN